VRWVGIDALLTKCLSLVQPLALLLVQLDQQWKLPPRRRRWCRRIATQIKSRGAYTASAALPSSV